MGGSNFKKFIFFTVAVTATFGISLAFQYAVAVWTAPAANPPTCNSGDPGCDAPLNISNTAQQKSGMLLLNYGNSATGLVVQYGDVGIGTVSPGAKLDVNGDIKLSGTASKLVDIIGGNIISNFSRKITIGNSNVDNVEITAPHVGIGGAQYSDEGLHVVGDAGIAGKIKIWNGTSFNYIFNDGTNDLTFSSGLGNAVARAFTDIKLQTWTGSQFADRLVVKNNGNVGIGTSTPDAVLTVAGSQFILGGSGDVNTLNGLDSGDFMFINQYLSGRRQFSQSQYSNADINGDGRVNSLDADLIANIIGGDKITLDQVHYSLGKYKANTALNYDYNGNVGLGTSSPTAKLDLMQLPNATEGLKIKISGGPSPYSPLVIVSSGGGDVFRIKEDGKITVGNLTGTGNRCVYVTNTGVLSAKTEDCGAGGDNLGDHTAAKNIKLGSFWLSGDGGDEGIRVGANGNVGIGAAGPVRKFHLADTNKTTDSNDSNVLITSTDAPDADIGGSLGLGGRYDSNNNPIAFATVYGRKENAASDNVSGYLAFAVRDHSAAPYNFERMRITSSGNVGIGTTNPQGDLVVAQGNASYIQGGLNVGTLWNGSIFNFRQLSNNSENIIYGAANSGSSFGNLLKLERCSNGATPDCATQFTVSNVGHVSIGNIAPQANTVFYLSKFLSAQSGAAYAARVGASLSASANNDKLYGLNLSGSGFSNTDSYSGVNIYGLHITGSTWGGTVTVANAYAIYTDAPAIGANNWAIYSASGNNYFGGSVTVDGSITLGGVVRNSWGIGTLTAGKWCVANSGGTAIDCTADAPAGGSDADAIIGNEVTDVANATLTRSGSGTAADPYKLALNLGNANTWTAAQTFSNANSIIISGTGTGLSFTQTTNDLAYIDSKKGIQLRLDTDDTTDSINDASSFIIVNGANSAVWSMDETGTLNTGIIPWGRITGFTGDADASDDLTGLSATAPISVSGSGNSRTVALSGTGCTNGQVLKWNGSVWACANDTDTNTTYGIIANQGLILSGNNFGLTNTCGNNQLLKWNNVTTQWVCADDNAGAAGTGGFRTKRVFVTSTAYTGNLGGVEGADSKCQDHATTGGLTGTWQAILSYGTTGAKTRLGTDWDLLVDIFGMPIATKMSVFSPSSGITRINFPLYTTELGTYKSNGTGVWTGTDNNGNATIYTCSNWTSSLNYRYGTTGRVGDVDQRWINNQSNTGCNLNYLLYCFEQ